MCIDRLVSNELTALLGELVWDFATIVAVDGLMY